TRHSVQPAVSSPQRFTRSLLSEVTLVGRDKEIAEVLEMLAANRLVTILGPGGVGKSKLAERIVSETIAQFRDGCRVIPLVAVTGVDLLVPTIGDAIGVTFVGTRDPKAELIDALRDKHLLLVMDGFEHIIAGSLVILDLLRHAPKLQILVTSRERL